MEAAPAWELSKENVQPIKRGRDVARLDAALTARPLGGDAATAAADQRAAKRRCVRDLARRLACRRCAA